MLDLTICGSMGIKIFVLLLKSSRELGEAIEQVQVEIWQPELRIDLQPYIKCLANVDAYLVRRSKQECSFE